MTTGLRGYDGKPVKFLKPTPSKVILFGLFMAVVIGGYIQAWAFSGKDMGTPRPFLYDILKPLPFWSLWMYMSLPLLVISGPFSFISGPLFLPVNMIYFYILASFMVSNYERYRRRFTKTFWVVLVGLALGVNGLNLIWVFTSAVGVGGSLPEIIMALVSGTVVILFYGYIFICIAFSVLEGG
jgi:hypothetical protein